MKKLWLIAICLLLAVSIAAQTKSPSNNPKSVHRNGGITCGQDPILPTDGSVNSADFVAPSSSAYYLLNLAGGHSYAVEVWDPSDPTITGAVSLSLLATSGCAPLSPQPTNVTTMDPVLSGSFAARVSWIQGADGQAILQVQNNDNTNFYSYNVRIVDTTLLNPRWSTYSGFSTQYGFVNRSSVAVTGTLTVYDHTGPVLTTTQLTVPASGENFQIISTPVDHYGFSTFAYVGAPGVVAADAYFINGSATVIVPSSFAPRNSQY